MPIRVDLHLDAAVTENALGHYRDHVDTFHLRRDDERRRLVVGICRSRPNRRHKRLAVADQGSIPVATALQKRHHRIAALDRAVEHNMRIEAHQLAIMIAVAVARSRASGLDVTQHGTSVAADGVVSHAHLRRLSRELLRARGQASQEPCGCALPPRRRSHSELPAQLELPPALQFPWRQTLQSTMALRSESIRSPARLRPMESGNHADSLPCRERILTSAPCRALARPRLQSVPRSALD